MSSSSSSSTGSSIPSTEEVKTEVVEASKQTLSSFRSLVAGGVGGVCAVIVGHPFDLVKVRMQTAEKGVYSGAFDVVRRTVAREGLRKGLYAGVSAPLVGVTPMFAVSFWGYDVGQKLVRAFSPQTSSEAHFTIAQTSTAGFFSAIPMTIITAPFERVKVLLQIQGQKQLGPGEKPRYSGGLDVVRQLYKEGGIRSVYRGSAMTLARDGPGSATYFATYEYVKRKMTPKDAAGNPSGDLSLTAVMTAGGAAGVAMWIPVFPIDTIKSRLQSAEGRPTIGGTIRGLYASGGLRAFFPGIGPAMARAVPANAVTFLGVELAHKAMNNAFGMRSIITTEKKATRKLKAKAVRGAMAVKTKDSNASKRDCPAYIVLANKQRDKMRQESPGIGQREWHEPRAKTRKSYEKESGDVSEEKQEEEEHE